LNLIAKLRKNKPPVFLVPLPLGLYVPRLVQVPLFLFLVPGLLNWLVLPLSGNNNYRRKSKIVGIVTEVKNGVKNGSSEVKSLL